MMKEQLMISADYAAFDAYMQSLGIRRVLCVCGDHVNRLHIGRYFENLEQRTGIAAVRFSGFSPNPDLSEVRAGTALYRDAGCDAVCGIGGGSAMDTAKCIKLYAAVPDAEDLLTQAIVPNEIPLLAVPTTAGSGSESTRYAVICDRGNKVSVTHESCIPDAVLLDPSLLLSLPLAQKQATAADALCHAVESMWSVHSDAESTELASQAIRLLMHNLEGYLQSDLSACAGMLNAANLAGRAINITATTAGHAMSYRVTLKYGMPHGAAVALCTERLFAHLSRDTSGCTDPRGEAHLRAALSRIADAMGCKDAAAASLRFTELTKQLNIHAPEAMCDDDLDELTASVNPTRLSRHPAALSAASIRALYAEMLNGRA